MSMFSHAQKHLGILEIWNACCEGNIDEVRRWILEGVNIHEENDRAMYISINFGHMDLVKFLSEKGVKADENLLYCAAQGKKFEIIQFLMDNGAIFNPKWKHIPQESHDFCSNYQKGVVHKINISI